MHSTLFLPTLTVTDTTFPTELDPLRMPRHVALIMDGNGRWAKQRGKRRTEGHRQGVENVRQVVETAGHLNLEYLTLYAFSAENWQRPDAEVSALMNLLDIFLKRYTPELDKNGIRLHTIGDICALPKKVIKALEKSLAKTEHHRERHLVLALNYGARQEMVNATQHYVKDVQAGKQNPDLLNWDTLASYLYTANLPDPDLMIRTSGETRMSNYLLMQCAYAELLFTPVLWPDFTREVFIQAIADYQNRERRFGLTGEQVQTT